MFQTIDELNASKHPDKNERIQSTLSETVHFHIWAKSMFSETADIYSLLIFFELICGMIYLSCCIFQMDLVRTVFVMPLRWYSAFIHKFHWLFFNQAMEHPDAELLIIVICIVGSGSSLFLYCFHGKSTNDSFNGYSQCLFDSKWYLLPKNTQKLFILMIGNAQCSLFYHGFHLVNLNLETFLQVRNILRPLIF